MAQVDTKQLRELVDDLLPSTQCRVETPGKVLCSGDLLAALYELDEARAELIELREERANLYAAHKICGDTFAELKAKLERAMRVVEAARRWDRAAPYETEEDRIALGQAVCDFDAAEAKS